MNLHIYIRAHGREAHKTIHDQNRTQRNYIWTEGERARMTKEAQKTIGEELRTLGERYSFT